jgi:putative transposase
VLAGPPSAKITALPARGADPMRTNSTVEKRNARINKSFYGRIQPAKNFCCLVRKKIYPNIKFRSHHNFKYTSNDLLDTLTHVAMTQDFTTNGTRTFRLVRENAPSPNTVLYRVGKLESQEVLEMFQNSFEETCKLARTYGAFKRKVDVAIDITDQLYYGDKNDPMVVATMPRQGTSHAYRFATINIVVHGQRFTLLALPMDKFTTKAEIVEKLVEYAKKKVRIGTVYVDRGFFSVQVISLLKRLGVKFLMPAVKNARIKQLIEKHDLPAVLEYRMVGSYFKLAIVKGIKNTKCVFATNLDVDERNAQGLFNMYRRRWGIETSYRVKHVFRAKTTSKRYVIRLFYFSFSVCLYNLWVLANIFVRVIFTRASERMLITAKVFGTLLYQVGDGG